MRRLGGRLEEGKGEAPGAGNSQDAAGGELVEEGVEVKVVCELEREGVGGRVYFVQILILGN